MATALITGASSGIGMELAGVLAREGHDLVLVARGQERLAQVRDALAGAYGVAVTCLPLDLAAAGAPEALVAALAEQGLAVDVLVNDAGFGEFGRFLDLDPERLRAMIRLNVVAPAMLCRLLGAEMARRGGGRILNVASVAGFMPGPWMAAYFSTKAQVLSLSQALSCELAGTGVTVTALCPGPTATPFIGKAHQESSGIIKGARLADPWRVAEYGYRAMMAGRPVAVHGLRNRLLAFAIRFLPRTLLVRAVERAMRPR